MGAAPQKVPRYQKPSYRKKVEKLLREYPILKKAIEIEEQLEREGLGDLLPSLTSAYGERIGGYSEYRSDTEKYGIIRANKQLRIRMIERALQVLDLHERYLIEKRYMSHPEPLDRELQERLCWSPRSYRRVKAEAIRKLAIMFNLE